MTITFEIRDGMDQVVDGLGRFLQAEVARRHEQHGDLLADPHAVHAPDGRLTPEVLGLMREVRNASSGAGYYTMLTPTELGGEGLGFEALFRSWETVFRLCGSRNWLGWHSLAHWTKGPNPLLANVEAAVRDRFLPGLLSGDTTMCFAMSEPDAGSDAWRMRTRAVRGDGGWIVNGEKQWISNAAHADLAIVFAVTDSGKAAAKSGGVTAFLVPTDATGFDVHSVIPLFGHSGSNEGIIQLVDLFVPDDHVVGEVDQGFALAMQGVSMGRVYNAAKGVGLARWALEMACDYMGERHAFGVPIVEHQGISFPIAESAMEVHAAHLLGLNTARLLDSGAPARKELAMAKAYSTEVAVRAVDRAMQVHGAMGFTNELGLAEAWQQLRQVLVADGSSEILRRQIIQRLMKGDREL